MPIDGLISIVIPAFNAQLLVGNAIRSVLAQRDVQIEVIVVDDGSTDGTAALARSFGPPVTCVSRNNGGPPAARNSGLAMARGEFIGLLDSDDVYEPGALALQRDKLQQNPHIDIVIGRMMREELTSKRDEVPVFGPAESQNKLSVQLGTGLYRRSVFDRVGGFEESLTHCDDWDWVMRVREQNIPMLIHTELVLRQRLHWNNLTRNRETDRHFISLMLKRSLDRRRAAHGKAESLARFSDSLSEKGSQAEEGS